MSTMQALVHERYGAPALLRHGTVAAPAVSAGQVLVAVHAAGVNAADRYTVRGTPRVIRASSGLRRPRRPVPGRDVAGVVVEVGEGVTRFRPGDAVVGTAMGSFAELALARADLLAPKPADLGWVEAGALPLAATTAIQGLRDAGRLQAGQRVLVVGASGGVGTFAVQIARAMGGVVSAVCSERNADLVRELGADEVIAYEREDWTVRSGQYDLVLQLAGTVRPGRARRALTRDGTLVLSSGAGWMGGVWRMAAAALRDPFVPQRLVTLVGHDSAEDLAAVLELVAAGAVHPVIERTWPLAQAADALAHVDAGHTRGKTVIVVRP